MKLYKITKKKKNPARHFLFVFPIKEKIQTFMLALYVIAFISAIILGDFIDCRERLEMGEPNFRMLRKEGAGSPGWRTANTGGR